MLIGSEATHLIITPELDLNKIIKDVSTMEKNLIKRTKKLRTQIEQQAWTIGIKLSKSQISAVISQIKATSKEYVKAWDGAHSEVAKKQLKAFDNIRKIGKARTIRRTKEYTSAWNGALNEVVKRRIAAEKLYTKESLKATRAQTTQYKRSWKQAHAAEAKNIKKSQLLRSKSFNQSTFPGKVLNTAQYGIAGAGLFALASGFRAVISESIAFDNAIFNNKAVLETTLETATLLAQAARQIGVEYGGALQEIDGAVLLLGRAGVATSKLADATRLVIQLATITGDTFEDTSKVVSSFVTVFSTIGVEALQADGSIKIVRKSVEELGDMLAYAANQSKLSTADLGTFSNHALTTAVTVGLTSEQVLALATSFSNLGVNASTIGTQIRKLDQVFNSSRGSIQIFWDQLGDNFNQQEFAKRIRAGGKDSEIALQQFYDRVADMPKDVLAAATAGMPILTSNLIKLISKSAELIRRHSEGLRQGGVDVAQQAAINALGASKLFERAANSIVKSSDGMATSLLDAFTGRQELIEYREELDRLLVGTTMYEEKTRELKERMDSLQEGFTGLSQTTEAFLEVLAGVVTAIAVVAVGAGLHFAAIAIAANPVVASIVAILVALKAIDTYINGSDNEVIQRLAAQRIEAQANIDAIIKRQTNVQKFQQQQLSIENKLINAKGRLRKAQEALDKAITGVGAGGRRGGNSKSQIEKRQSEIKGLSKDIGVYKKELTSLNQVITQLQKANVDQTGFKSFGFSAAQEAQSKAFVERRRIAELFDKSDLVFQQRKLKLLQESLKEEKSRTLTAAIKLSIEKKEAIVAEQINKVRSLALRGSDDQTALGNAKLKLSIAKAANGVARTGVQIAQDTAALTEADIAMRIFEKTLDEGSLAHILLMTKLEKERFAITVAQNKEKRDAAVQLEKEVREAAAIRAQEVKIAVLEAFNPEDKRSAGDTDRFNEAIALQERSLELAIASDIVKGREKAINTENIKLLVLKNKKLSAEFDLTNEIADAQEEAASAAMDATITNIELLEQSIDTFSAALDAANGNNWAKTLSKNIGRVGKTFTTFSKNRLRLEDKTDRQEKIHNDARKAAQTDITLLRAADSQNKSATNRIESEELGNQLSLYSGLAASAGAFFEEGTTGAKIMQTAQLALGTTMAFVAIAAASTLPLVGLAQGAAMAAALAGFAGIWLGSSPGGGSVQQVNPDVQAREALGAEESLVIGRLDRQIELLESIDFSGSANAIRSSQAREQFNFDIKGLELGDTGFAEGIRGRKEFLGGIIESGEDFKGVYSSITVEQAMFALKNESFVQSLLTQIETVERLIYASNNGGFLPFDTSRLPGELTVLQGVLAEAEDSLGGFVTTMIDVVGVMTDTGDTFKDLLDGLTGTSEFADKRLASAVTDVNGLLIGNGPTGARGPNGETAPISQVALEKFLRGQIIAIDKVQLAFNKSVQEVLLSEESSFLEKEEAVRALNVATGKAFTVDNVQAAIDYVDSIELVAEAMINSNENTKSFEDSLKTSAQLQAEQAAALGVTVPQTTAELLEMVEGFKEAENGIKLFNDAEREFAGQQLDRLNEIRETSDANIQSFGDSLKTSEQLLQIMAKTLGVDVVKSTEELTALFIRMQGGVDGLTNEELKFLEANKGMIKSLEAAAGKVTDFTKARLAAIAFNRKIQDQELKDLQKAAKDKFKLEQDALNATLTSTRAGLSTLESALSSLDGVSARLRKQDIGAEGLVNFQQSLSETLALSGTGNSDAFSSSLQATLGGIGLLDDSRAFASEREQQIAQLKAANTFDLIEDNSLSQIDLLKMIEENTAGSLDALLVRINESDSSVREQFLGDRDRQDALDEFNKAADIYFDLNRSGGSVGLTAQEWIEVRRPFAEQLEELAGAFIDAGGSASTQSGFTDPIHNTIGEVLGEITNLTGFANGGISTGAQVALVSEGSFKNEAHVPLPDGRAIPVNLGNNDLKETIGILAGEIKVLQEINSVTAKHMRRLDQRDELKERG